jgi:HD-GYP domain-containing protein (c-di-GMP phosphodiesterase class II)
MATVSLQSRGYLPIATASLCPATVLDCDLYIQLTGRSFAELYRGASYPLETEDIEGLRAEGVDHLYIRAEDAQAYRDYLCANVLHDKNVSPTVRVDALREVTRVAFQDALASSDCDQMVEVASTFGGDLASIVADRSVAFRELYTTLAHDYYTFTHVCNVSVYCTMLASHLGTFDAATLAEIAAGALLHDIGKRNIPPYILNKPTKLTDEEWELVREHPTTGFREVATRADLNWGQLMMIYQHHERNDGSGYPAAITSAEIHPWAKMCAVADVFDALTCQRPYRKPMPLSEVSEYLAKHAGQWFDPDFVHCWLKHIRTV